MGTLGQSGNLHSLSDHAPDEYEYKKVRVVALTTAVGVMAWIAFGLIAFERLDTFATLRISQGKSAVERATTLSKRVEAASVALQQLPQPLLAPTITVMDVSGPANTPLSLGISVTDYAPGTAINISDFPTGTEFSVGMSVGINEWRIMADDLSAARVTPPADYVGIVLAIAELRNVDGHSIIRMPIRLMWGPPIGSANASLRAASSSSRSNEENQLVGINALQAAAPAATGQAEIHSKTVDSLLPGVSKKNTKHSSRMPKRKMKTTKKRHHRNSDAHNEFSNSEFAYWTSWSAVHPINIFDETRIERTDSNDSPHAVIEEGRKRCKKGSACARGFSRHDFSRPD